MTKQEIIDIIKTQKKYSGNNFIFSDDYVTYIIGDKSYKISISSNYKRVTFNYSIYNFAMLDIKVNIPTDNKIDIVKYKSKVLSKFREVVRNMDKFDSFMKIREKDTQKIKPAIERFIKNQYDIDIDLNDRTKWKMNYPKTIYVVRNRSKSSSFDITKEKLENIKYEITVWLREVYFSATLNFTYYSNSEKLILISREESYRTHTKDITKIIRGEKLKKLMLVNEEVN